MYRYLYTFPVMDSKSHSVPDLVARVNIDRGSRVALAAQIARQLTWLIATGVARPDSFLPTIADMAQHLGVNIHTVRAAYRQLADDGLVSMRRGSRTLVLGYDRDQAWSRRENRQSSFTIGVLVPSFTDYYAEFLDAISKASEIEGWLPVICQTRHYDPRVVARDVDQLLSRNVDGIIVIHFDRPDRKTAEIFKSASALRPFVFVDSHSADTGSRIVVDEAAAGFRAVSHLLEHGHRRIGFVDPAAGWGHSRFVEGSTPALAAAGVRLEDRLVVAASDWSLEAGSQGRSPTVGIQQAPDRNLLRRGRPGTWRHHRHQRTRWTSARRHSRHGLRGDSVRRARRALAVHDPPSRPTTSATRLSALFAGPSSREPPSHRSHLRPA